MKKDNSSAIKIKKISRDINDLVNELDLMSLIASGAPKDEYSSESLQVTSAYFNSKNTTEFKKQFALVFIKSFGLKLSQREWSELERAGGEIYNKINN